MPSDKMLLYAALHKWADGETLSSADFSRVMQLINTIPLQIDSPTPDAIQAKYAQFRQVINERYLSQ